MELKSESTALLGIVLIFIILGSFIALGFTGLRTILGMIIIVFLPFYLIFSNFNLNQGEKTLFSFFISITLFPSLVYGLGFLVSFKISIFIVFLALITLAYLINKFWKK